MDVETRHGASEEQEEAIEIAATQTKSAQADFVITGVANPDLVLGSRQYNLA